MLYYSLKKGRPITYKPNPAKAVIFDIDGTLSPEISWLALTRDLGASVDEHIRIHSSHKKGQMSYEESKNQILKLWQATGNTNKPFFKNLFESWPLDPAADGIVKLTQTKYATCLITGSMDLYARVIAEKLNVENWYANATLHWDENGKLVDMDYFLQQADKKLEHFADFCQKQGIEPQDCIVVGDSENDIGLFKISGRGILLLDSPDKARGDHRQYAWKTAASLSEARQYIL